MKRNLLRSTFLFCCFAAVLLWSLPPSAVAQKSCGGIEGRVTTEEGWMVPNVRIRSLDRATKQSTNVESNGEGVYIACLSPGNYDVFADAMGFKRAKRKSIKVEMSSKSVIDFVMKRGKPVTSH
jgi:hypothetical protein